MKRQPAAHTTQGMEASIILLSCWICLQLECNLMIKLDLPPSTYSLTQAETLPWPCTHLLADELPSWALEYFLRQSYQTSILSDLFKARYDEGISDQVPSQMVKYFPKLEGILMNPQRDPLNWKCMNPSQHTIHWDTLATLYRPVIMMVLNTAKQDHNVGKAFTQEEIQSAGRGLYALEQSFGAFDRNHDQISVPNVISTIHAQCGKVLVLTAAYNNRWLRHYVDSKKLPSLLAHIIEMLETHEGTSIVLLKHKLVLQGILQDFETKDIAREQEM
nr:C6 zinc finger domain-containing protein [Colletotrichum truncatum]KAF6793885.1 C6 zinc finger domain-containing protein [Colletotrichum truncatum]